MAASEGPAPLDGLTYPGEFVGASLGMSPTTQELLRSEGYHLLARSSLLGLGDDAFAAAVECLLTWQMHRRAGVAVATTTPPPSRGLHVDGSVGRGPARQHAPCLVVAVVDRPDRQGFAYGTLAGHPECGEESFLVERRAAGDGGDSAEVWFHVSAFSRPASRLARWSGPVGRAAQRVVTARYAGAMLDAARAAVSA